MTSSHVITMASTYSGRAIYNNASLLTSLGKTSDVKYTCDSSDGKSSKYTAPHIVNVGDFYLMRNVANTTYAVRVYDRALTEREIRRNKVVDVWAYTGVNVEALVESMDDNIELFLSSSNDVVNDLNFVEAEEREVFFNTLNENNVEYTHFDNLEDCLKEVYERASKEDIILLLGAQGMDPAESLLKNIL